MATVACPAMDEEDGVEVGIGLCVAVMDLEDELAAAVSDVMGTGGHLGCVGAGLEERG